MNPYHIPQYLDEPFKIMLWTIDEFLLFLVPFLLLMFVFGSPLWGLMVGALCMYAVRKIKGEQGHYFIFNVMYWYLPEIIQFKATPPSYLRQLLG
jgi:conjugal transfer pilus assembly protein TraL